MNRNGRNVRINLWATPKEKEQMDKLAEKYGLTVSALIRFLVMKENEKNLVMKESEKNNE